METIFRTISDLSINLLGDIKLIEKGVMGIEGSYVEFLTLFALVLLGVLPVITPNKHRQRWRHFNQLLAVFFFVMMVFTCLGVFGLISNFFTGLREVGKENIVALYFCSVPVIIFVISMFSGPIFCGWICPTGAIQEFAAWLSRKIGIDPRKQASFFSLPIFIVALISLSVFLLWVHYLTHHRIFFVEDSVIYWAAVLIVLLFLLSFRLEKWDKRLRRIKYVSLAIVVTAAVFNMKITSPVHFAFSKTHDPSSLVSTAMVLLAAFAISRFWCKYLCPWRCVISWAAKRSVKSIQLNQDSCNNCHHCDGVCDMAAIEAGRIDLNECHMCFRCVDNCPTNALYLRESWERS